MQRAHRPAADVFICWITCTWQPTSFGLDCEWAGDESSGPLPAGSGSFVSTNNGK